GSSELNQVLENLHNYNNSFGNSTIVRVRNNERIGMLYKEVVVKNMENIMENGNKMQSPGNLVINLELETKNMNMLERSLVGDTLEPYELEELRKVVMNEWHTIEDVRMLGSMKMLIIFNLIPIWRKQSDRHFY
ncbi:hypothetical protein PIB30_105863, partial [Stylosanthes scabra]|nr:hypothetical protein [Stylosanthes scabra]